MYKYTDKFMITVNAPLRKSYPASCLHKLLSFSRFPPITKDDGTTADKDELFVSQFARIYTLDAQGKQPLIISKVE